MAVVTITTENFAQEMEIQEQIAIRTANTAIYTMS